ncbi:MAG: PilZ domain-containing protein [Acidobacteria bacterium]|nr:PilZ domain-containing protein [Acidobacteriota bacterium]
MAQPQTERRGTRRFSLRLPVAVQLHEDAQPLEAHTKDVSARGVYFLVPAEVEEGMKLEFLLTLPPEITLTESIRVRCRGRAIRVDHDGTSGHSGVAAIIDDYQFLS